jgi:hypothetical protein
MASTRLTCDVTVLDDIARTFPSRPDRVQEVRVEAAKSMEELAAGRKRTMNEPPRLVNTRETGLGFVVLTFECETRAL